MNKDEKCKFQKLSVLGLGMACGLTWGLATFMLGLFNIYGEWGGTLLDVLSSLYIGFDYTIKGAFIGLLWGLGEGFLFGSVTAIFYNLMLCCKKLNKNSSCSSSSHSCCGS